MRVRGIVDRMISGPGFAVGYREDEVTRQQVRPGTVRRVWPYLRRYRGQMVLLLDQLLAAGGAYAGLYRTQFAPQAALLSFLKERSIS